MILNDAEWNAAISNFAKLPPGRAEEIGATINGQ
jgi:hypothetical protein